MGAMVEYIQLHKGKPIEEMKSDEIRRLLRKTFRYAQDKIKDQYRSYLVE